MQSVTELRAWLADRSRFAWRNEGDGIAVEAPSESGFTVWVCRIHNEWTTFFDGWHHHFDSEGGAIRCALDGLNGKVQLEVTLRGATPYRWAAQVLHEGSWTTTSVTGFLLFPFWKQRRVEFRRNPILE
jgi:hypothetical protein